MISDVLPVPARSTKVATCCPSRRRLTTHVTGGLDGALRVAGVLRSRGYRVLELSILVQEDDVESEVVCTVLVTNREVDLLLERMRRLPSVVSSAIL